MCGDWDAESDRLSKVTPHISCHAWNLPTSLSAHSYWPVGCVRRLLGYWSPGVSLPNIWSALFKASPVFSVKPSDQIWRLLKLHNLVPFCPIPLLTAPSSLTVGLPAIPASGLWYLLCPLSLEFIPHSVVPHSKSTKYFLFKFPQISAGARFHQRPFLTEWESISLLPHSDCGHSLSHLGCFASCIVLIFWYIICFFVCFLFVLTCIPPLPLPQHEHT